MIVRRDRSRGRWTAVPNDAFELSPSDGGLSLEAKGLLGWLLVKPDSWEINIEAIRSKTGIGRDRAYALVAELQEAGYVERRQIRDPLGRVVRYEYVIFDEPASGHQGSQPLPAFQEVAPLPGLPDTAQPDTANQEAQIRTNIVKTTKGGKTSFAPRDDRAMFDALCAAFEVTPATVTTQTRGQFNRWIKGWRGEGVRPEHVARAANLYRGTYRGRKGETPTRNELALLIARARAEAGREGAQALADEFMAN